MTSFLDTLLRKPGIHGALASNKVVAKDPDDDKKALRVAMAKLTDTLGSFCCFGCHKPHPVAELDHDQSGYICGGPMGCGTVLAANVKAEPRANYDNDPALEQHEKVRDMVSLYDSLPHLFDRNKKLTEAQQWQQLRARQAIIIIDELAEHPLLSITHDEVLAAKSMLVRMFKGMKPDEKPTDDERGSPCFWAMVLVRELLSGRDDGFTVRFNNVAQAWSYQGLHAFLSGRSIGVFYQEDSRLRMSGRLAHGIDAVRPQRLAVHGLGDQADMQRKLNCVVRLVNQGTRTHDDDTTMYLDVPHLSAPGVVPTPFDPGPSAAPAVPRVKIARRHDTKLRGIQKPRLPRPERDHADFEAYMAEPDNGFLGAGYTGC